MYSVLGKWYFNLIGPMHSLNIATCFILSDSEKVKYNYFIFAFFSAQIPSVSEHCGQMVTTCISMYNTIQTQLLPTPAKSHYTFNLRDLSKVFQGVLMCFPGSIKVSSGKLLIMSVKV